MFGRDRATIIPVSVAAWLASKPALAQAPVLAGGEDVGMQLAGGTVATLATFFALGGFMRLVAGRAAKKELPEPNIEELLPLVRIDSDGQTVLSEDGTSSVVLEVAGINYAATSGEFQFAAARARWSWLQRLGLAHCDVRIVFDRSLMAVTIKEAGDNEYLREVNRRWGETFADAYANRSFIILSDRQGSGDLISAIRATRELLTDHAPRLLRHESTGEGGLSPLFDFLQWQANGWRGPVAARDGDDLPQSLGWGDLQADDDGWLIESDGLRTRYSRVVTFVDLAKQSDRMLMNRLLRLPFEMTIWQYMIPMERLKAEVEIKKKRNNAFLVAPNPFQDAAFSEAFDRLGADEEGFGEYDVAIFTHGETKDDANKAAEAVMREVGRLEFVPKIDQERHEAHWRLRFPAKAKLLRPWLLSFSNMADLTPFEGTPRGLGRCWWGASALRVVRTVNGSPFEMGIHEHDAEEALGNGAVFGRPGGGKTVLMAWLITGALSYFPRFRAFCFDNLDGLTVPTNAFGGVVVRPGQDVGGEVWTLAPLQMDDTRENREFLGRFFLDLAGVDDFDSQRAVRDALDLIMPLERKDRTLDNFFNQGIRKNTPVSEGLRQWIGTGTYAGWFDGARDALDLEVSRWVTFDMQRVIEHPKLAGAFVSYILHRIRTEVWSTPTPHIIFMDEAATLFAASSLFRDLGAYLSRNIRKKMGSVFYAFQDPEGMGEHAGMVTDTSANFVFLRDPSASADDYADFNLSEGDMRFIQDQDDATRHVRRAVLWVRKTHGGVDTVPLDVNLEKLGNLVGLFRSGTDAADQFKRCHREFGSKWVGPYLNAVEVSD